MKALWISVLIVCSTGLAVPVTDYTSALELGYQYLDPRPESEYVARETRILIRFDQTLPADLANLSSFIEVVGEKSGLHTGTTTIATDGRTVVFAPATLFHAQETVDVALMPLEYWPQTGHAEPIQYRFGVLGPAGASLSAGNPPQVEALAVEEQSMPQPFGATESVPARPMIMGNGVSVPSDFPHVRLTKSRNPGDGYIFTEYRGETLYALILDNSGAPVWYRRGTGAEDLKVHRNGMITETQFKGYDQDFNWIRDFHAGNGYETDSHDLQVLEDGSYLILGLRTISATST